MRIYAFAVSVFLLTPVFCQDYDYIVDTVRQNSGILNEERTILIYKPQNFSEEMPVNLIYLLDGENATYRFKELQAKLSDSIPNLIAVAVVNTDRRRDLLYSYQADKFLEFISSELIPFVEKDFSINTRILFGHSFAGSFVLYAMIHKPANFDFYIASSPTPIMDLIDPEYFNQLDSGCKSKTVFYFSTGSDDLGQVKKWTQKLKLNLSAMKFDNFEWKYEILEGKNHDNSDIVALIQGLRLVK